MKKKHISTISLVILCFITWYPVSLAIVFIFSFFAGLGGMIVIDRQYLSAVSVISYAGATVFELLFFEYRMKINRESEDDIKKDTPTAAAAPLAQTEEKQAIINEIPPRENKEQEKTDNAPSCPEADAVREDPELQKLVKAMMTDPSIIPHISALLGISQ